MFHFLSIFIFNFDNGSRYYGFIFHNGFFRPNLINETEKFESQSNYA